MQVKSQTTRMFSPQCSSILIEWQTHDTENPKLSCTPAQIQALFNHERLLVYGFILNCTQVKSCSKKYAITCCVWHHS